MLSSSLHSPTICKTKHAYDSYWYCLASMTSFCFHRFAYGSDHFCLHDDKTAFRDREADYLNEVEPV
jgi:hypothetical protein